MKFILHNVRADKELALCKAYLDWHGIRYSLAPFQARLAMSASRGKSTIVVEQEGWVGIVFAVGFDQLYKRIREEGLVRA